MTSPDDIQTPLGNAGARSELETAGILVKETRSLDDQREVEIALGEALLRRVRSMESGDNTASALRAALDAFFRAGDAPRVHAIVRETLTQGDSREDAEIALDAFRAASALGETEEPEVAALIAERLARSGSIEKLQAFCASTSTPAPVEALQGLLADPSRRLYGHDVLRVRALVEGREALLADIPAILSSAGAFFHVDDITTPYAIAGSTVPASIFETLALNEVSKGDNCRSYSLQTIISAAQKEGVAAPRVALERLANDALAAGDFTEARAHLKEFDPDGGEDRIVRRAQELFMELRVNDGPQAFLDASGAKSDHELRLLLSCVRELHAAGEVFAHEDVVACVMASIPTFVRMGQMHDAGEHSEYVCRHADAEAAYHVDNAVEILSLLGAKDALIALADGIAGKNRHCAVPYLVASIYEKAGATDRLAIAAECHLRRGNLERAMELYERSGQVPTREALEALVDGFCEFLLELRSGKTVYNEYDEPMPDSVLSERLSAVEKDFLFVKRMAERPDVRAAIAPKDVPYAWPVLPSSQQEVSDGWGESEDDDA